ncbi:unnamed protein product [Mytilus coruscus]|uniref:Ig-like domain-containing protein n=1 Tax=Mytilus coruscus TaxID=42192 RepID=A0A6J8BIW7_MYTCO|nr:unnamed protein product [Mytilus coruscus]
MRIGGITYVNKNADNHVVKISGIKFEDIISEVFVTIMSSKTDQIGCSTTLILSTNDNDDEICVVKTLKDYLQLRPDCQGQLFCHLYHNKLTRFQFLAVLRSALNFLSLNPEEFNTHSFRIGAATTAALEGKTDEEIQSMGRWNSNSHFCGLDYWILLDTKASSHSQMRPLGNDLGLHKLGYKLMCAGMSDMSVYNVVPIVENLIHCWGLADAVLLHCGGNDIGLVNCAKLLFDIKFMLDIVGRMVNGTFFILNIDVKVGRVFVVGKFTSNKEKHASNRKIVFVSTHETVVFNCTCFNQNESTWRILKRSAEIGNDTNEAETRNIIYTQGLLLNPKLINSHIDISGDYERGECNLIIRNFSTEDTGTYKCQYWETGFVWTDTYNVYLRIPPSDLKIQHTIDRDGKKLLRGIEETKLTVVCTVKSGKPEETLVLKTNGSTIQRGKRWSSRVFVCSYKKGQPGVIYKPDLVIHNINPETFVEGHSTKLCCQAYGNPHVKTIEWNKNGESVVNGYDSYLCLEFTPLHRSDAERYTCKATKIVGPSELAMLYTVLYPPVIDITRTLVEQNITLVCNPNGEPNNYTFDDWEHHSEFKEYIRSVRGTQDGKLTILKAGNKNRRHEDDGIYTCKSSNGIPDVQAELYQKGTVLINDQGPPIFVKANKRIQFGQYGQKINLSVFLYNKFGNIQTRISNQNMDLKIQSTEENIQKYDLFHNVNVTVNGIKISFQMVLNKSEDFKDYTIKACNQIG